MNADHFINKHPVHRIYSLETIIALRSTYLFVSQEDISPFVLTVMGLVETFLIKDYLK